MVTPSTPRFTSPNSISWSMTVLTMFDGIAKPMPMFPPDCDRMAVLMPTSSPRRLTSAPPELPGLMAASVWMKFSYPSGLMPDRPSALTMPEVTVCCRPNGLPIATTKSPTRTEAESARLMSVGSVPSLILMTATSEPASAPTSSACSSRSSSSVTVISCALSTTWALVTM